VAEMNPGFEQFLHGDIRHFSLPSSSGFSSAALKPASSSQMWLQNPIAPLNGAEP
jgi:hypothetical protein